MDRAPDSAADRALDAANRRIDMLAALLKLAEPVYTTRRDDGSEIAHPTILAARAAIAKAIGSDK
jgi:hypothetical protein